MPAADPQFQQDSRLLEALVRGEPRAAEALAAEHVPRCHAQAFRMLGNAAEAEDVAQEAMLRLWKIAPEWRVGEAKVTTWLHRITSNLCIDRLRKRKRVGPGLDEIAEPPDPAPSADMRLIAGDRAAAVKAAILALPDRQRVAITMRHFEENSNPEIAEALGVSVEAVESLLSRGRKSLARALSEMQADADKMSEPVANPRGGSAKRKLG